MAWNWARRKKKSQNDKVFVSIWLPTIRNSWSWWMRRMPKWLLGSREEAGRTGVKRAHLKVGRTQRGGWPGGKLNRQQHRHRKCLGHWENRWLNTLRKRNPTAKAINWGIWVVLVLLELPLQSHCQERKKSPEGSVMERACSWYSRSSSWTQKEPKTHLGRLGRVLYWQRIRMHSLGRRSESGQLPAVTVMVCSRVCLSTLCPHAQLLPSVMVHIHLKKTISLEEGTFCLASTSSMKKITELWEGKCSEFRTGDFQSPAVISHLRASIFPL